jgi:hypothetical protein
MSSIRISCGVNTQELQVVGRTVGWVRQNLAALFNISDAAEARVNGEKVADTYVLEAGAEVEFVKVSGQKGLYDGHQDPMPAQPFSTALLMAEKSLLQLEQAINLCGHAQIVAGGSIGGYGSPADGMAEVGDMIRRSAELVKKAIAIVESAWGELDESGHQGDWDAAGRRVLAFLDKQAAVMGRAVSLRRPDDRNGLPRQAAEELIAARSLLLERARDFRDSWPWSTGNKPDDEADAAAGRKAAQVLPSFEALSRVAKRFPPPPEWLKGD